MRRQEIRDAVDQALAERGYSPALYCWPRAGHLHVLCGQVGKNPAKLRLPSGIGKKGLAEALKLIPQRGLPRRTPPVRIIEPQMHQTDLIEAIERMPVHA